MTIVELLEQLSRIWQPIVGIIGIFVWLDRRRKKWMKDNITTPINRVHRRVDSVKTDVAELSGRVHTLEIVHNTEGVSAQEITDMLANRKPPDDQR